jgi:hypothetical protein
MGVEADPYTGATVGVAPAVGMIGRRLAALGILAVAGPAALQAQVGLSSGAVQVALLARSAPRASINEVGPSRETSRRGNVREASVNLRLSANTGYRLVVVGTGPVSSNAAPASRLWVRTQNGRFEELRSGSAVTVVRGHHAVDWWEPELSFRTQGSESAEGPPVLPVRYELRIDPAI